MRMFFADIRAMLLVCKKLHAARQKNLNKRRQFFYFLIAKLLAAGGVITFVRVLRMIVATGCS